jgi:3-phenylpropionate/trans-cinnamate dioxygenase ferredoxin component
LWKNLRKCECGKLREGGKILVLVKVCDLDIAPVPGSLKAFKVGTLEVLITNVDGQFYCTSARCTHSGGAPLSEGTLDGIVLTCPWHEAQFRVTDGKLIRGPAKENLRVYRNIVKENHLFIEV